MPSLISEICIIFIYIRPGVSTDSIYFEIESAKLELVYSANEKIGAHDLNLVRFELEHYDKNIRSGVVARDHIMYH